MVRLCFVCLGNICRSPTAQALMMHYVKERGLSHHIDIDSAGTGGWHVGSLPDKRSREAAKKRGIILDSIARQFRVDDFARFDLVLAMDLSNRDDLLAMAPDEESQRKVRLLRDFDPDAPAQSEVPDPYHGGLNGFEEVLDICERACTSLLDTLIKQYDL